LYKEKKNLIKTTTPAVTRVDECTKALTGVGAAIAAGNQEEIGTWALFVKETKITIIEKGKKIKKIFLKIDRSKSRRPIKISKSPSPMRFLNKVKTLLFTLFQFL